MNLIQLLQSRLDSRAEDFKVIEQSQHSFDAGKRAALRDEIRWLQSLINRLNRREI